MSAYKDWDEPCDPDNVVRLYNNVTGTLVYSFCQVHQYEYVLPGSEFNLDYFRMARDYVIEIAEEAGKKPVASLPFSHCVKKVFTNEQSLAEYLFGLEVADEEES
jgi:hypothetical protein